MSLIKAMNIVHFEAWINVGNYYNYIFMDNLIKNNLVFDTQLTLGEDAVFNVSAFLESDTFFNLKSTSYVQNRIKLAPPAGPMKRDCLKHLRMS